MLPQVVVPSRRFDAGAITARVLQTAMRPWRPRCSDLDLGKVLEDGCVFLRRRPIGQYGRMPGSADHRDPFEALFLGGANRLPHPRLTPALGKIGCFGK